MNHSGQFPSVTISFNLAPGKPLGTAVEEILEIQRNLGLPASVHGQFLRHRPGVPGFAGQ